MTSPNLFDRRAGTVVVLVTLALHPLLALGDSLRWSASGNTSVWDSDTTTNWINISNNLPEIFSAGDRVLFDDTLGVPTTVTISGTVWPDEVTVNSGVNNYTISGAGAISGPGSLVKRGSSTLEIAGANDFTGPVTISGGTVMMYAPLSGPATSLGAGDGASIVVTNGATLAVNASGSYPVGNSGIGPRAITISGAGVGGAGALRNVGNDIYHDGSPQGGLFQSLTLAGDATIGGNGRWDLGHAGLVTFISTGGQNFNLTCLQGGYSEWHEVTLDPNLGDIDYILASAGEWRVRGMGSSLGNPTNTLTLHPGVNLSIYHGNNFDDNGYAKIIRVQPGAQFTYRPGGGAGDYYLAAAVQLDETARLNFYNGDGGNNTGTTIGGPVRLNGVVRLTIGDSPVTFTNVLSGPGGFIWVNYNNVVTLLASNTYTGPTVIGNNRTLELSDAGSIAQSALLFFGGNNSLSVRLDVSARADQTLTLTSGQTLAGIGRIDGSLTVRPGATLAPAGTNTTLGITAGANPTGRISATNAIVLQGTTTLKLNGSGGNDQVQAGAGITYGGLLHLVNISAAPLVVGNSFQVFSAASYAGSFANIFPPTPGAGLAWDTAQLNNGFLTVRAAPTPPAITLAKMSGSNLIFSGTGGPPNSNFMVLTSTNLNTPLPSWTVSTTNSFDGTGGFSVTNPIVSGTPQQFYLLRLP